MTPTTLFDSDDVASQLAPAPVDNSDQGVPYRWLILLGLITAAMMEVLDTTIINVSLPQMAGNLGATTEEIAWVSTSYILANVVVLPMTAFFTERFGRRNYLTFSILLFIGGSTAIVTYEWRNATRRAPRSSGQPPAWLIPSSSEVGRRGAALATLQLTGGKTQSAALGGGQR